MRAISFFRQAQPPVALQLAGGRLEPQIEQLLLGLAQLLQQLLVVELAQRQRRLVARLGSHQPPTPSRDTKRHFIGSLWIARRMASRATFSSHTGELEHHATGLDVGDPPLRRTLTGTHAGLGRLLGQRTVRVDVDPDLSATLDVPGHGDTGRLDLTVRHVGRLQGLDAVLAEGDRVATLGRTVAVRVVLLAVLDAPRDQHGSALPCCALGRGSDSGRRLDGRGRGCLDGGDRLLIAAVAATGGTTVPVPAVRAGPAGSGRGGSGALLRPRAQLRVPVTSPL